MEWERRSSRSDFRRMSGRFLSIIILFTLIFTSSAIPDNAWAASRKAKKSKKAKASYSISVHNINSNTVMKKGSKIKIAYTARKKKKGVVKKTKVGFKSSNKKVATVSKKGVIKAKKKGTAYITVYCRKKTDKKKRIRIRVGTPVSSVTLSGFQYLGKGRSRSLKAAVNRGASNKKLSWKSSDASVAAVNSSGKVTAKGYGVATIFAKAKDGSGVTGERTIYVPRYTKDSAKWIAHRGLHISATENTAAAFIAAGKAGGFWGCECDIWETKHEKFKPDPLPEEPAQKQEQNSGLLTKKRSGKDAAAVIRVIQALDLASLDTSEIIDHRAAILAAKEMYDALDDDAEKYQVREGLRDEDEEGLQLLFDSVATIKEYDSIGIVINHDMTYDRVWGSGGSVHDTTRDQIKSRLPEVCFLEEYADICKTYGMVPVVEFKDSSMSDEAVKKAIDIIYDADKTGEFLRDSVLISFDHKLLSRARAAAFQKLNDTAPDTYYLFDNNANAYVDIAADKSFTGISVSKGILTESLYNSAKSKGLSVGTWTYYDNASNDELLGQHLLSGKYELDFATVDYKVFQ